MFDKSNPYAGILKSTRNFLARDHKLFIDGQWVNAVSGATRAVIDPATAQRVSTMAEGGAADIDLAVRAARKAFEDGPWGKMPVQFSCHSERPNGEAVRARVFVANQALRMSVVHAITSGVHPQCANAGQAHCPSLPSRATSLYVAGVPASRSCGSCHCSPKIRSHGCGCSFSSPPPG